MNYAFNIPGCGLTALVYFSDVKKLVVNSYLWHPTYGYFKIIAFDFQTGQVTILNQCQDDNAAPGTNVPACTCFIVSPTPFDTAQVGASCVAIDFTAPAISDCLDITVTNVNGLEIGGTVAIGSGIYRLEAVVSPFIITICNDGEGITPGTPVIALDANGDYQYCLSVTGSNPCTKDIIEAGVVIVCSDDTMQPLGGTAVGQLLTLTNAGTDEAAYATPCDTAVVPGGRVMVCESGVMKPLDGSVVGHVLTLADATTNDAAYADPACIAKTILTDIPLENYNQAVTLSDSPVAGSGTFAVEVDANVITINVPAGCSGNYLLEAVVSIGAYPNLTFPASAPNCVYHEIEINWNAAGSHADGKMAWVHYPGGTFSAAPAAPTNSLVAQLGTIADNLSGYSQATVAQAITVAAGSANVLHLNYRTVAPNVTDPLLAFSNILIQIDGYVKLTKI